MLITTNEPTDRADWHQAIVDEARMSGKVSELIRSAARRQIINEAALKNAIQPTEIELQVAADNFRRVNQLTTIAATSNWLAANFISIEDFEQILRDRLITAKLAHHLFADRVEQYFWQNSHEYSAATLYEIVLTDRYVAMELFYAIAEGDLNFTDVAQQYITDPELNRRGGYLGTLKRRQLHPAISAAVFAATPPQTIAPVTTDLGIHLIRVVEIVEPQLDETLSEQILMELFDLWLAQQLAGEDR
ncbi:peptidylprolyl isomerase [Chamaesiphon sp. VAR_69_metabat_338]|uniref:peptidylprolyl isomerase n=1 Tax=Chamaesiphon sp. VAR_69_metabat_338 TaxID=2964704 RepID=UPI00286E2E4F|nr:peptidylprolyl isomerase [Chamaesiphon sp. VAR_69_metabat_338]